MLWKNFFFASLLISMMLFLLGVLASKAVSISREFISPLECGFSSAQDKRLPISLRFFVFAVIFVIFDVELIVLMPILESEKEMKIYMIFFFMFVNLLTVGLFHEWNNSALDWVI